MAIVLEMHDEPPTSRSWHVLDQMDGVVAISDALRLRIIAARASTAPDVWVEHDGADLPTNGSPSNRDAARQRLGITETSAPIVLYAGRAIAGKGVDVLLSAVPHLSPTGVRVIVVGKVYEPEYLDHAGSNLTFTGFIPPSEVQDYLAAADVLVLPPTGELPYAAYTSPLKLFEYMASGRPIVASDLPVLSEVLVAGENALVYPARDPEALARAIRRLLEEPGLAAALAARASRDVRKFAWTQRARRILQRISAVTGLS